MEENTETKANLRKVFRVHLIINYNALQVFLSLRFVTDTWLNSTLMWNSQLKVKYAQLKMNGIFVTSSLDIYELISLYISWAQ